MNITILANRDVASNLALNLLLPQLSDHQVTVFLSAKVGANGEKPPALTSLKFVEQDLFNQLLSPLLNNSQAPAKYRTFEQLAEYLVKPVESLNQINSDDGIATIRASAPDLIISIRYGGILKDRVLAMPSKGVLNLHSGLLPAYRGVMATFWAMHNGEQEIGTSLHFISDSKIDTGDIIAQSQFKVNPDKSYLWHVLQLYVDGCQLIASAVADIAEGRLLSAQPQSTGGCYYSFPEQSHIDHFCHSGYALFDHQEFLDFITTNYLP